MLEFTTQELQAINKVQEVFENVDGDNVILQYDKQALSVDIEKTDLNNFKIYAYNNETEKEKTIERKTLKGLITAIKKLK